MQITHNGKTYRATSKINAQVVDGKIKYYIENGYMELITKPEEKPTEDIINSLVKEISCNRAKILDDFGKAYLAGLDIVNHPEYLKEIELVEKRGDNEYTWQFRMKLNNDKAMEIPDLMEDDTLEMIREREEYDKSIMEEIAEVKLYHEYKNDDWEYAITDAVNLLIKAHNNK